MTFFSSPLVSIGRTSVIRPCERLVFFWMRRGGLGRVAISLAFPPLASRSFFGAYPRSQPANNRGQYRSGHRPLKPLWSVFTNQRQASVAQAGLNPRVPLSSRLIGRIILALAFVRLPFFGIASFSSNCLRTIKSSVK